MLEIIRNDENRAEMVVSGDEFPRCYSSDNYLLVYS